MAMKRLIYTRNNFTSGNVVVDVINYTDFISSVHASPSVCIEPP